jgi:hypothetical protein
MNALHSLMSKLNYAIEPEVECPYNDPDDAAFVQATATIGGCDSVEEYMACKMNLLSAGFSFKSVPLGMTHVLKVETHLPLFAVGPLTVEHADHFLVEMEMEAKRVVGSFRPREYDALGVANIPNSCRLNWLLELMGVSYAPRPLPGSKASQVANKKRKAEVSKKSASKRLKASPSRALPSKAVLPPPKEESSKKVGVLKISRPKAKPSP